MTDVSKYPNGAKQLIDDEAVRAMIGGDPIINKATLHRWVKRGIMPPPIKLGPRLNRWDVAEVADAIRRCADARKAACE